MVEFKAKADKLIKERYGIEVEHVCAMRGGRKTPTKESSTESSVEAITQETSKDSQSPKAHGADTSSTAMKLTYEDIFYRKMKSPLKKEGGRIYGFPMRKGNWCNSELKIRAFSTSPIAEGADKNTLVQYLGIAADEPIRLARLDGVTTISPLAELGWTEADCRKWCEENDLLSPIYSTATRGGCWFCHNQSLDQLRLLRKTYPDLWALLMKWDLDSPVTFRADGRTVHELDRRFQFEEEGLIPLDKTFRWKMFEELNKKMNK